MEKFTERIQKIISVGEVMEHNEIFLELKMLMFDTQRNLNGVQYTKAFIEDIVENKDKYICLPLLCDVETLLEEGFLTHLLDEDTGTFGTLQVGSFKDFELEYDEAADVTALIGYARVPKRNGSVCDAFVALHEAKQLKFSYEMLIATYTVENGIMMVDKSEDNSLIGLCVVTDPAHPNAVSLMVAENQSEGGENLETEVILENEELVGSADGFEVVHEVHEVTVITEESDWSDETHITVVEDSHIVLEDSIPKEEAIEEPAPAEDAVIIIEAEEEKPEEKVDLAEKVAQLNDAVIELSEKLRVANEQIAELTPFKVQVETEIAERQAAEKAEKVNQLKAMAERILNEDEMVEVAEAIENLDEIAVKARIADKYIAMQKDAEVEIATASASNHVRISDQVVIEDAHKKYFS